MPRKRERGSPKVVHRTAKCGLRLTPAQKDRVFGLLRSAGDVWCCVIDMNRWRRKSGHDQVVGYQELCRLCGILHYRHYGDGWVMRPAAASWLAEAVPPLLASALSRARGMLVIRACRAS